MFLPILPGLLSDRMQRIPKTPPSWTQKQIHFCPTQANPVGTHVRPELCSRPCRRVQSVLLDLVLKVLALYKVGNVIIVSLLGLLHVLVALSQLAERGERVRAELVQDARDELSELLVLAAAVNGEGVGLEGSMN